jgi:hypothetical protein
MARDDEFVRVRRVDGSFQLGARDAKP